MATFQELKGSRQEWEDNRYRYGERLYISISQADANIPDIGDGFTDAGDVSEAKTAVDSRIAVERKDRNDIIPGLWISRIIYRAFKAFAADG